MRAWAYCVRQSFLFSAGLKWGSMLAAGQGEITVPLMNLYFRRAAHTSSLVDNVRRGRSRAGVRVGCHWARLATAGSGLRRTRRIRPGGRSGWSRPWNPPKFEEAPIRALRPDSCYEAHA